MSEELLYSERSLVWVLPDWRPAFLWSESCSTRGEPILSSDVSLTSLVFSLAVSSLSDPSR
jgi:hypothetical protein